jgi:hypothetical protein
VKQRAETDRFNWGLEVDGTGRHGKNVFYQMQVVHEAILDAYFLFTRHVLVPYFHSHYIQ